MLSQFSKINAVFLLIQYIWLLICNKIFWVSINEYIHVAVSCQS